MTQHNPDRIIFNLESNQSRQFNGDPYYDSVRLQMSFDYMILDKKGHTFSSYGARPPEINFFESRDKKGCLSLLGNSSAEDDFCSLFTNGKDFSINDYDDACIEFWAKFPIVPVQRGNIISCHEELGVSAPNWRIFISDKSVLRIVVGDATTSETVQVLENLDFQIKNDEWTHFAYVKEKDIISLYVNGKKWNHQTISMQIKSRMNGYLSIGSINNSWNYSGVSEFGGAHARCFIDDLRITIGEKRYKENFTFSEKKENIFKGITKNAFDEPVSRRVCLYRRSTGELIDSTISDKTTGEWTLKSPYDDYHFIVMIDDNLRKSIVVKDWI